MQVGPENQELKPAVSSATSKQDAATPSKQLLEPSEPAAPNEKVLKPQLASTPSLPENPATQDLRNQLDEALKRIQDLESSKQGNAADPEPAHKTPVATKAPPPKAGTPPALGKDTPSPTITQAQVPQNSDDGPIVTALGKTVPQLVQYIFVFIGSLEKTNIFRTSCSKLVGLIFTGDTAQR